MNRRCILYYWYLTINTGMIRLIWSKYKLEFFNGNWSYSYNLKRVFATYQRMRANRTSWAGTSHQWYHLSFINIHLYLLPKNWPLKLWGSIFHFLIPVTLRYLRIYFLLFSFVSKTIVIWSLSKCGCHNFSALVCLELATKRR